MAHCHAPLIRADAAVVVEFFHFQYQMIIQLIDTEKSDFDAFDLDHRRIIVAKGFDSIFFQGIYRILKTLLLF